jgi:hypothetical protein
MAICSCRRGLCTYLCFHARRRHSTLSEPEHENLNRNRRSPRAWQLPSKGLKYDALNGSSRYPFFRPCNGSTGTSRSPETQVNEDVTVIVMVEVACFFPTAKMAFTSQVCRTSGSTKAKRPNLEVMVPLLLLLRGERSEFLRVRDASIAVGNIQRHRNAVLGAGLQGSHRRRIQRSAGGRAEFGLRKRVWKRY